MFKIITTVGIATALALSLAACDDGSKKSTSSVKTPDEQISQVDTGSIHVTLSPFPHQSVVFNDVDVILPAVVEDIANGEAHPDDKVSIHTATMGYYKSYTPLDEDSKSAIDSLVRRAKNTDNWTFEPVEMAAESLIATFTAEPESTYRWNVTGYYGTVVGNGEYLHAYPSKAAPMLTIAEKPVSVWNDTLRQKGKNHIELRKVSLEDGGRIFSLSGMPTYSNPDAARQAFDKLGLDLPTTELDLCVDAEFAIRVYEHNADSVTEGDDGVVTYCWTRPDYPLGEPVYMAYDVDQEVVKLLKDAPKEAYAVKTYREKGASAWSDQAYADQAKKLSEFMKRYESDPDTLSPAELRHAQIIERYMAKFNK